MILVKHSQVSRLPTEVYLTVENVQKTEFNAHNKKALTSLPMRPAGVSSQLTSPNKLSVVNWKTTSM